MKTLAIILAVSFRAQVPQLQSTDLVSDSRTTINNALTILDNKIVYGTAAPTLSCSASQNLGKIWINTRAAQAQKSVYICAQTGTYTYEWEIPYRTSGGLQWKGNWRSDYTYAVQDVAFSAGTSYVAIVAHTNSPPPSAFWETLAAAGIGGGGGTSYTFSPPLVNTSGTVSINQALLSIGWSQLTGLPSTFAPAAHTHPATDITGTLTDAQVSDTLTIGLASTMPGGLLGGDWWDLMQLTQAATPSNTLSTLVKRDASGNFAAGTITANVVGNVTGNASGLSSTLGISNGGTGGTTASAARASLGAQATITGAPGTWPSFSTVATSGAYADLSGRPTLGTAAAQANDAFSMGAGYQSGTRTAGVGGTTAGLLVKYDTSGNVITALVNDTGILGVAVSSVSASASVEVATRGIVSCVADNATTIGNVVIVGSATAGRCRDAGTSSVVAVSLASQVVGRWLSTVAAGATGSVQLFGPGHYGAGITSLSQIPNGTTGALLVAGASNPAWSSALLYSTALANTINSVSTARTPGYSLINTTAAAAGAQQNSPCLLLTGQGWKTNATAASQQVDWCLYNQPVQGAAAPTSQLNFDFQVANGGYSNAASLTSAGQFLALSGTASAPTFAVGNSTSGMYSSSSNRVAISAGSAARLEISAAQIAVESVATIGWNGIGGTNDTMLRRCAAGNVCLGSFDAAAPVAQTLSMQNVATGTSNTAGPNFTLAMARGTGSAQPGDFVIQHAPAGSSGTAQNALAETWRFRPTFLTAGGITSASPALKRFGNAFAFREADDTLATVSTLTACASGGAGALQTVSDASSPAIGSTVAGGGSTTALVWCNGTSWKVFAF